jgi:hypothetical protein
MEHHHDGGRREKLITVVEKLLPFHPPQIVNCTSSALRSYLRDEKAISNCLIHVTVTTSVVRVSKQRLLTLAHIFRAFLVSLLSGQCCKSSVILTWVIYFAVSAAVPSKIGKQL